MTYTLFHEQIDFAFRNPIYNQLASGFKEEVAKTMIGAFERRCQQVNKKISQDSTLVLLRSIFGRGQAFEILNLMIGVVKRLCRLEFSF